MECFVPFNTFMLPLFQGSHDAAHLPDRGGHVHGRGGAGRAQGVPPDVALPPPAERPRRTHHIRQNGPGKAGELQLQAFFSKLLTTLLN